MKTFSNLLRQIKKLNESEVTTGGASVSADSHYGIYRIENSEQLDRINAFINAFTRKEFIEPNSAMAQLRHKFNLTGLDFDWDNSSSLSEGDNTIHLNRFGGSFGTTPTHNLMKDGFFKGDNIKEYNNGKGLDLRVNLRKNDSSLYKIDARIVPSEAETPFEN
jgi:hypothetical protein